MTTGPVHAKLEHEPTVITLSFANYIKTLTSTMNGPKKTIELMTLIEPSGIMSSSSKHRYIADESYRCWTFRIRWNHFHQQYIVMLLINLMSVVHSEIDETILINRTQIEHFISQLFNITESSHSSKWDVGGSIFFAMTVVSTIG